MFRTLGERTTLETPERNRLSGNRRSLHMGVDIPFLLVVIALVIFGFLMVYSASMGYTTSEKYHYNFTKQFLLLVAGIAAAVFLTFLDYHHWQKLVLPAMSITIVALVAILVLKGVNQSARDFIAGSIQPSELAKIVTIIYLAVWLYSKRDRLWDIQFGLIPMGVMLGFLGALIFLQPDLSALITIFFLGGVMFFLAGGKMGQNLALVVLAIIVGFLVVQFDTRGTGQSRVENFLMVLKDITQADYHVRHSLMAFVNGEWFGVGIGKSEFKLYGLPVPETDSIFAVIGEELGLVGAAIVVLMYVFLLWRGMKIAFQAPDGLGSLLAAGLTIWICIEAFINMAVMVGIMPFAGNALPFISRGGSNLLVSFTAVGIILNVSRLGVQHEEGSILSEVVNLRWRDGRRRIPRSRRASGAD